MQRTTYSGPQSGRRGAGAAAARDVAEGRRGRGAAGWVRAVAATQRGLGSASASDRRGQGGAGRQRPGQTRKTASWAPRLSPPPSPAPPRPPPEVAPPAARGRPAAPAAGGGEGRGGEGRGGVRAAGARVDSAPACVRAAAAGCSASSAVHGRAQIPVAGEDLELLALGGPADEQKPLNGTVQVVPVSGEEPRPAQANEENPWSSCNKKLIGKCKLWMVIASVFLGLIVVIIVSLCLSGVTYIDEDANEILELSSNKTFLVMLKIPEECVTEEELPHLLTKRLTDVYTSSPSLSRYFTSVEMTDFSGENATIAYHLQFGVPSEDDSFMRYMMNEELVRGVLLQSLHDEGVSGCETLGLGPASFLLYE